MYACSFERDELARQSGANWSILLSVGKFETHWRHRDIDVQELRLHLNLFILR